MICVYAGEIFNNTFWTEAQSSATQPKETINLHNIHVSTKKDKINKDKVKQSHKKSKTQSKDKKQSSK